MNKIVELLIDWDEMDFSELGVDIMSLVSEPAIGIAWQKFAAQKFVEVKPGESEADYVSRCIPVLIEEGFDQDQAAAICYGSYEEMECEDCFDLDEACWPGYEAIGTKIKDGREVPNCVPVENTKLSNDHLDHIEALVNREDFGRTFDPATTSYVDMSKETFADEAEVISAIGALNDLIGVEDNGRPVTLYRYRSGRSLPSGSESRRFCAIMMSRANKYYTIDEINEISNFTLQPGMGEGGSNYYDVFKYKGGVNCRHYWTAYRQYESGGRTVVTELGRADGDAGQIANSGNDMWRAFKKQQFHFSEDQQIVTAPAMIPNMLIPRKDAEGNMFHVYFSQDTVRKIAAKFLEENKQHNTDINHDDNVSTENTLLESWIVEDPEMDKSKTLGFNVPPSTWMVSYKINNPETWKKIKEGELNGFSIAGQFIESNTKY